MQIGIGPVALKVRSGAGTGEILAFVWPQVRPVHDGQTLADTLDPAVLDPSNYYRIYPDGEAVPLDGEPKNIHAVVVPVIRAVQHGQALADTLDPAVLDPANYFKFGPGGERVLLAG